MADTTDKPVLPEGRLTFSLQEIADMNGLDYQVAWRLLRSGAFGADWQQFPRNGRWIRVPRARVLAWAKADEADLPAVPAQQSGR